MKSTIEQAQVAAAIRAGAADTLSSLMLFDRYHGKPLAEDEISLAYRLRFEPDQEPLAEADIDAAMVGVARQLGELGARIRGPEET